MRTRVFAVGPNSSEDGKWFAEQPDSAAQWGHWIYGSTRFYVIEARFRSEDVEGFGRWPNLDNRGAARYAQLDDLNAAKPEIAQWTI
jgi:hypothetical protein